MLRYIFVSILAIVAGLGQEIPKEDMGPPEIVRPRRIVAMPQQNRRPMNDEELARVMLQLMVEMRHVGRPPALRGGAENRADQAPEHIISQLLKMLLILFIYALIFCFRYITTTRLFRALNAH